MQHILSEEQKQKQYFFMFSENFFYEMLDGCCSCGTSPADWVHLISPSSCIDNRLEVERL